MPFGTKQVMLEDLLLILANTRKTMELTPMSTPAYLEINKAQTEIVQSVNRISKLMDNLTAR